MKPAKPSTRKVRNRSGKLLTSRSSEGRRRNTTFKLESLEERLLLSIIPGSESNSSTPLTSAVASQSSSNQASYIASLPTGRG